MKHKHRELNETMVREAKVLISSRNKITYTLEIKQVKNINLRITREGAVRVSANPFVPLPQIDEFVDSRAEWIRERLKHVHSEQEMREEDRIVLLGNTLKIRRVKAADPLVYYSADTFYVQYQRIEQCETLITKYLDQLCRDIFSDIAQLTCRRMKEYHLEMPTIRLRTMKSQWGNCKPAQKVITLNKRLIHYPVEFIEYVILHEFAHFVHPNHSRAFYALIEKYMPDYKERIAMSQRN